MAVFTIILTGFMSGWVHDEKCVARQEKITGRILPIENIKHYPGVADALEALYNGEVNYCFLLPAP